MPERMKPYRLSIVLLLLLAYLGVQALTGERGLLSSFLACLICSATCSVVLGLFDGFCLALQAGLLSGSSRDALLGQREAQLAHLTEQRRDLETRVRYLRSDSLSKDLLEERARAVLGFSDPRDYVIAVQAQSVQG